MRLLRDIAPAFHHPPCCRKSALFFKESIRRSSLDSERVTRAGFIARGAAPVAANPTRLGVIYSLRAVKYGGSCKGGAPCLLYGRRIGRLLSPRV